jgi:hypothetical protein
MLQICVSSFSCGRTRFHLIKALSCGAQLQPGLLQAAVLKEESNLSPDTCSVLFNDGQLAAADLKVSTF